MGPDPVTPRRAPRLLRIALGLAALVVLALGAGLVAFLLLAGGDEPAPPQVPAASADAVTTPVPDARWRVARGRGTFAGYRVGERYLGVGVRTAVGRTPALTGTVTTRARRLAAARVRADLRALRSDKSGRDDALRTRGLETDVHPSASFRLASPVAAAASPHGGTGVLTLHGRTARVPLRAAARVSGRRLVVAGFAAVDFARFGIDPPSVAGLVTVSDHGRLEFRLELERVG